ncbi:MAG: MATE family efflux transporter [Candidatus Nomurabacteria bacterium]|nr:MATE family efflux transporter [Candidatus Nomurabacteria bacterium]USN88009.1 MAG: MATE family efflux transporter [Candidatus Nomurabacteria bacterium]
MTNTEHRSLTNEPVPILLRSIAVPASIGFFFNTMYNVVDSWVAGQISGEALAALSVTFPVFFIIIALAIGIGTGVTALIANELGAQKTEKAKLYATQTISFGLITSIIITIAGYLAAPTLFKFLGASDSYLTATLAYMQPIFLGSIFIAMVIILNGILNAVGNTKSYRNVLVAGFFLNVLLSPTLALGWFGLPTLGILGIAVATLISNLLGLIYISYKVWQTKLIDRECLSCYLKPNKKIYADIMSQGLPASLNMMTVAIGAFIITYFVSQYGKEAVAGYGTAIRVEQMVLIPSMGINMAVLALIGQNNGAKRHDRITEIAAVGIRYILILGTIGTTILFFAAAPLMKLFTEEPDIIGFGVGYLAVAAFITWAYGIIFVTEAILRGLKKPIFPLILGVVRQTIVPLTAFYLVTFVFTLSIVGLWWSIFIIVWSSALISLWYTRRQMSL